MRKMLFIISVMLFIALGMSACSVGTNSEPVPTLPEMPTSTLLEPTPTRQIVSTSTLFHPPESKLTETVRKACV
jgi:hypothetical protein